MSAVAPHSAADTEPQKDVAISFLSKDERLAGELGGRLEERLRVFFYPRAQEELAGTDGLESMRAPFLTGSRIVVVLYRSPWGKTPWTRVEETAIKDGCLERGWDRLFFVQLDRSSELPTWLPRTHVRFILDDYGIDELVGAIKARVQEAGGKVDKPSAAGRAKSVQREAEYLADRQRLFRDRGWIVDTVQASVITAVNRAVELVNENGKDMTPPPRGSAFGAAGGRQQYCTLTNELVSLAAGWKQEIFNDVSQEAGVFMREFSGAVAIPGERKMYAFSPQLLRERKFVPALTTTRELAWVEEGKKEQLSTEDLGQTIAMAFFDLIARSNRGEIERPFG